MLLSDALARTSLNRTTEFQSLNDILSPEIIEAALASNQVATLRRRKLPMDAMVWAVIGMALFRGESVRQLITKLFFDDVCSHCGGFCHHGFFAMAIQFALVSLSAFEQLFLHSAGKGENENSQESQNYDGFHNAYLKIWREPS